MLFCKYPDLLKKLVAHLLKIPIDSIVQFEIKNPEMPPDSIGKKFCRLDIHMVVNGQQCNLEVQVENEGDYPDRALFHWARIYSNALPVGDMYKDLPRAIIISILDFPLFTDCTEFHSEFQALEVTRTKPLTDKMVLHFFELPKLPERLNRDDLALLWLALFKANTEEELKRIEGMGVTELSEAVAAYNTITASSEFHEMERLRIKASHDEAQALYNAGEKAKKALSIEIAKKMLIRKRPVEEIVEDTGLTHKEVERLKTVK